MNEFITNHLKQTIKTSLTRLNHVDKNVRFTTTFYEPTNSFILIKYINNNTKPEIEFEMEVPKYRIRDVLNDLIVEHCSQRTN